MANIVERHYPGDRDTCLVGAGGVVGGNLVELSDDLTVVKSTAASVLVTGVALTDALAGGRTTVIRHGIVDCVAQGAITQGQRLIAGTVAGSVAAAGVMPDARTVVGHALADIANTASGPCRIAL